MFTPDFAMNHTATVEKWLGRGVSADEYGAPVAVRCRVNLKRKYAVSGASAVASVVALGTVFLPADTDIAEKDRLTFNGRTYIVTACQPAFELSGAVNHIEVDIQ